MVVNVSGTGIDVSYATVTSPTTLSVSFFIDPSAFAGSRSVTVTTPAGTSAAQPFTVSFSGAVVVSLDTDSNAGTPGSLTNPPGTGNGNAGDLRSAILSAGSGSTIVFNTTAMCGSSTCVIPLNGPLPPIENSITLDGGLFGRVIVDGGAAYRAFFVDNGTVTLQNLQIQRALAEGGAGGGDGFGGGGGAGLGAGIFVNNATVNVRNVYFYENASVGGTQNAAVGLSGGGGGGLGGNGGVFAVSVVANDGGTGGGGVLGAGSANSLVDHCGGNGGIGGGGGSNFCLGGSYGLGGIGYGENAGGSNGSNSGHDGGAAGFGGGGGGGVGAASGGGNGGNGGFGGGGGGCGSASATGGNGGAGGGGGGCGGTGGLLTASIHGGNGAVGSGFSGGGAAAGPAIFVNTGVLTTTNSGASGATAIGGAAGGTGATAGTADATPVFNYAGTVNGSTATGPIPSALSSAMPSSSFRHQPNR